MALDTQIRAVRWHGRRRVAIPLAALWLCAAGFAVWLGVTGGPSAVPLGDTAAIDGGVVRVSGVIPLENDGWVPGDLTTAFTDPVVDGAHRIRVLIDLGSTSDRSVQFSASDYTIDGLGVDRRSAIWSSTERRSVGPGEDFEAMMVFEVPDRAISLALVKTDPSPMRLLLGAGHHSGFR